MVSITDYGAFVELEKGIEGLIHISEMSWTQHIKHPSKIMNVGDKVDAVVLSVDKENEKISLGIKQMEPDPWTYDREEISDRQGRLRQGSQPDRVRRLCRTGRRYRRSGAYLRYVLDQANPASVGSDEEGRQDRCQDSSIDHENRRISLGFKQLNDDPWPEIAKKYSIGSECLGTITRVLDRGVMVES